MDRIPIYLVVMLVALAGMTTNIYNVHKWNLGIVKLEPWRQKLTTGVARLTNAFARCVSWVWPHRQQLAVVTCALLVLIFAPHNGLAMIGVAGTMKTLVQLEADKTALAAKLKTRMDAVMHAAAAHVVTPATATAPAVVGREWTPEERAELEALAAEGRGIKAQIDAKQGDANLMAEYERLTDGMRAAAADGNAARETRELRSLGQQYIADPTYRAWIKAGNHRHVGALSPGVTLQATTLDTSSGSGGPLILPDNRPGIVELLFKRLLVAELAAPGTTDSNLIAFMKETTFTNTAAAVLEAGLKPESTLIFAAATSAVRKLAHWIPVTEEMLEDFAQTASIIDARLRLGLALTEEDEILNGSGIAPHLLGWMNLPGLSTAVARGADSNADAIFKQNTAIATTVFVLPDGIVMNPLNWQTIQLTKNAAGNYLGSGPWAMAQQPTLWGLPVAVTPSIVANTALVGAFKASCQVFRKGGIRVESSNSHASFFVNNLVAIRAEERLASVCYREAALGKVTGLA